MIQWAIGRLRRRESYVYELTTEKSHVEYVNNL